MMQIVCSLCFPHRIEKHLSDSGTLIVRPGLTKPILAPLPLFTGGKGQPVETFSTNQGIPTVSPATDQPWVPIFQIFIDMGKTRGAMKMELLDVLKIPVGGLNIPKFPGFDDPGSFVGSDLDYDATKILPVTRVKIEVIPLDNTEETWKFKQWIKPPPTPIKPVVPDLPKADPKTPNDPKGQPKKPTSQKQTEEEEDQEGDQTEDQQQQQQEGADQQAGDQESEDLDPSEKGDQKKTSQAASKSQSSKPSTDALPPHASPLIRPKIVPEYIPDPEPAKADALFTGNKLIASIVRDLAEGKIDIKNITSPTIDKRPLVIKQREAELAINAAEEQANASKAKKSKKDNSQSQDVSMPLNVKPISSEQFTSQDDYNIYLKTFQCLIGPKVQMLPPKLILPLNVPNGAVLNEACCLQNGHFRQGSHAQTQWSLYTDGSIKMNGWKSGNNNIVLVRNSYLNTHIKVQKSASINLQYFVPTAQTVWVGLPANIVPYSIMQQVQIDSTSSTLIGYRLSFWLAYPVKCAELPEACGVKVSVANGFGMTITVSGIMGRHTTGITTVEKGDESKKDSDLIQSGGLAHAPTSHHMDIQTSPGIRALTIMFSGLASPQQVYRSNAALMSGYGMAVTCVTLRRWQLFKVQEDPEDPDTKEGNNSSINQENEDEEDQEE